MASSDYAVRGTGVFCSTVRLTHAIGYLDDTLTDPAIVTVGNDLRVIGEGILLGDEIVRLTEVGETYIKIARGCMDTIPQVHEAGTIGFFYEEAMGGDQREYAASETISVKVLPHTNSSPRLPIENAPPNPLTFDWRFIRPYAPGQVRIDGKHWFEADLSFTMSSQSKSYEFTWANRNRVTQADQLIDHTYGNITPERGQVTVIRFHDSAGALVLEKTSLNTSLKVTLNDLFGALGFDGPEDLRSGFLTIGSLRDGYDSYEEYRTEFTYKLTQPYGLGYRLGESLGGDDLTRPYGLGTRVGNLLGGKTP